MFGHTGPFSYSRAQDDLPHQLRGLSQDDFSHQRRGFSQDDLPHQSRGFSQDDLPHQRRGFSQDDFPHQRRGFSQDDLPHQRRGFSQDDFPHQKRGFSQDDFPHQRRGFSQDDFPHQRRGFSQDDFPHQRRGFSPDDLPHQKRGFSQDDYPHQRRGFSQDDFPHQRRGVHPDDLRGDPLPRNSTSRPNGKSIYNQRKEYSETLNKHSDNFNFRVEHLFTCELDGLELKTVDDCVAKLKRLDAKGRLWPQEMIMEIQGGYLLLSDIETKAELEALPFGSMLQTTAVLDSCAYNSLLTVTVQERSKRHPQVYFFQCEETGAEHIKSDLEQVIQIQGGDVEPRKEQPEIRINLENILGQHTLAGLRQAGRPVQREMSPPPPEQPSPQWREPEYMALPRAYSPPEPKMHEPDLHELQNSPELPSTPEPTESQRNAEIFNHVLRDLEIFMDKVAAAADAPSVKEKKKNMIKRKKSKKAEPAASLPPWKEYVSCLQKFKYAFNLLGQLEGALTNPSAPDYIHIFFSGLRDIVPKYPSDLPPSVISPLLTVPALRLLSQVVSPEEDHLWVTLGDSWNLPRSKWPEEVPPYIPEFYDGWQPPPPSRMSSPFPQNGRSTRNSQRFPPGQRHPEEPMTKSPWGSPSPTPTGEPPQYMRVMNDFVARNNQELGVMKGDKVQVIQKSKQWWLVRNSRNEEGNVPQNVLEPMRSSGPMNDPPDTNGPVTLNMTSTPAEVKAWLRYKGFSKITISSLGVLTGKLLLGMTKGELRTVCPEEGGKVFFQLQAIKSAIALASEPSGQYNSHY